MDVGSLRIGPDRIAYLAHRPDWSGLDPTLAGLGPDWIKKNGSVSYSGKKSLNVEASQFLILCVYGS